MFVESDIQYNVRTVQHLVRPVSILQTDLPSMGLESILGTFRGTKIPIDGGVMQCGMFEAFTSHVVDPAFELGEYGLLMFSLHDRLSTERGATRCATVSQRRHAEDSGGVRLHVRGCSEPLQSLCLISKHSKRRSC